MEEIFCDDILPVDGDGVWLIYQKDKMFIDFEECARNYAIENNLSQSRCVATRDVMKHKFIFFTMPKTIVIFKNSFWKDVLLGKSAINKFHKLQKEIICAGYSSYDLS